MIPIIILVISVSFGARLRKPYISEGTIDPKTILPYQFSETITGDLNTLVPTTRTFTLDKLQEEYYELEAIKTTQQILPSAFPATPVYVYSGKTINGVYSGFPGPGFLVTKNVRIKVLFRNLIQEKHMLPVDHNYPFNVSDVFLDEVPIVPHFHGLSTPATSDGLPMAYWTAKGKHSPDYHTEGPCAPNEAVYIFPNEQSPGNYWYHDHTIGITRLNVYAGLVGLYKVKDEQEAQSKYLIVTDRTFKEDGSLFYPDSTTSRYYTSWVPELFGDTIVVNGKVWPKMALAKRIYNLVLLNGCQCRYINFYFLNQGSKIPFTLVRADGDFYQRSIVTYEYLLSPGSRIQIQINLENIDGQIIMKNNAAAPYPDGDPDYLIDAQTGTIMRIDIIPNFNDDIEIVEQRQEVVRAIGLFTANQKNYRKNSYHQQLKTMQSQAIVKTEETFIYPRYDEGIAVMAPIVQIMDEDQNSLAMFIDGVSMKTSQTCQGQTLKVQAVYDYYIINLTPDTHPIHFHLVNLQKVLQFKFDVDRYKADWFEANGGPPGQHGYPNLPIKLDARGYNISDPQYPKQSEKVFKDIVDANPQYVTLIRMKISHNDGTNFSFPVNGSKFVWHCHMLEHQDNQMMRYFMVQQD